MQITSFSIYLKVILAILQHKDLKIADIAKKLIVPLLKLKLSEGHNKIQPFLRFLKKKRKFENWKIKLNYRLNSFSSSQQRKSKRF